MKTRFVKTLSFLLVLSIICGLNVGFFASTAYAAPIPEEPVKLARFGTYTNDQIDIRDTYVLTHDGKYYLFGTEGKTAFSGTPNGYIVYVGDDLENWEGPYQIYPNKGWDGTHKAMSNYWAPEAYEIDGKFYMFSAWRWNEDGVSTEQRLCVLVADNPLGPYTMLADDMGPGNDPTLYEEDGEYYLIYNYPSYDMKPANTLPQGMVISKLSPTFDSLVPDSDGNISHQVITFTGNPRTAPGLDLVVTGWQEGWETYVTPTGRVVMMWSFTYQGRYASGLVYFDDGIVEDFDAGLFKDYTFANEVFTPLNMGHNNFFETLDGQLMMGTHFQGTTYGYSIPVFFPVNYDKVKDTLVLDRWNFYKRYGDMYWANAACLQYDPPNPKLTNEEIDIRDTYILTYGDRYYMFGTQGEEAFSGTPGGFEVYIGDDLETWEGPYTAFPNDGTSWAKHRYWANEVYEIDGTFYMFGGWSKPEDADGPATEQQLCVLTADNPAGPYTILNDCLGPGNDPTLYKENGKYYLLYNDPVQPRDTRMMVSELSSDFSSLVGERTPLFDNSHPDCALSVASMPEGWETFITPTGRMILMWSFQAGGLYASSLVYFDNGIFGDLTFTNEYFTPFDMGHNNFFYSLDGQLMMCTHYPNSRRYGFPLFFEVNYDEANDTLVVDRTAFYENYGDHVDPVLNYYARCGQMDPKPGAVSVSTSAKTSLSGKIEYTFSAADMVRTNLIDITFTVNGNMLSGADAVLQGLNDFQVFNPDQDIRWTDLGNNQWQGNVILGTYADVTKTGSMEVGKLLLDGVKLGDAALTITAVKAYGIDSTGYKAPRSTARAVSIMSATATTEIYSIYNIEKSGDSKYKVDQADLSLSFYYYQAKLGDANWSSAKVADVNGDDIVNMGDLILIYSNYIA